jgi:hypothetical protein
VCTNIVQAEASWERQAGLEAITLLKTLMTGQCSNTIVNLPGNLRHGNAGFSDRLRILSDLTMDLGGFAIVTEKVIVHVGHCGQMTELFGGGTLEVLILDFVVEFLAFRIDLIAEDFGKGNSRRSGLLHFGNLLVLLLVTLTLLLATW